MNQLDRFTTNYIDLIAEYDATEGAYPFDCCKYEITEKMGSMMKQFKGIDFSNTLRDALQNAIKYQEPVLDSLSSIFTGLMQEGDGVNTTQQYFKEIGELYKRYKGDEDLKYCPENRDKLISLNTKMVVSVAKKYQGLGLSLQELISAGNLGLCTAWDKYDPSKSQLKDNFLEAVTNINEPFTKQDLLSCVDSLLTYGSIRQKIDDHFKDGRTYTRAELSAWVDKNVYNAKFSSIAMMWIKAFILIEIDNNSRVVKKPKSEIYKDKEATGAYQKECLLNLDAPIAGDTDTTFADTLGMEADDATDLDVMESYDEYKENLNKLLEGVSGRDRRVLLSKYGIGLPRPLLPKEIADNEKLSVARISQVVLCALTKMRENAAKYEIDPAFLFEACSKFR
jgi:DNA-directed RNA polymerase sigma subunit (sigma70/sigma32)